VNPAQQDREEVTEMLLRFGYGERSPSLAPPTEVNTKRELHGWDELPVHLLLRDRDADAGTPTLRSWAEACPSPWPREATQLSLPEPDAPLAPTVARPSRTREPALGPTVWWGQWIGLASAILALALGLGEVIGW
jgi:hypothetical protein